MKARVMEQLGSSGAAAMLTKFHGKVNIKNKKCSRSAMVTTSTPKPPNFSEEADNQEMGVCLERIQNLVPFTNKNKTLSNLDIITSAIFYIRDLQETLGLAELDTSVHTEDNLDLIPSSGTLTPPCMETEQSSEASSFSAKCSIDSPSPTISQSPTTTSHSTSSSPAMTTIGGDSLSSLSTITRQRYPLSVIPSPNSPSPSAAANCRGYRISQKS